MLTITLNSKYYDTHKEDLREYLEDTLIDLRLNIDYEILRDDIAAFTVCYPRDFHYAEKVFHRVDEYFEKYTNCFKRIL